MLVACRARCPTAWPKPPTRLLLLTECMPIARHRLAIASTGTAPDCWRPLLNFTPTGELLPANQWALCLFTATPPARPHGCAGTFPRTPPNLPTGATVNR